ncbi:MAG TPA: O-antigen ligase family protein [Gaiellaceae bacterium]|nr:O-antigen ligase family protein [Gaiellaceae bacterium]
MRDSHGPAAAWAPTVALGALPLGVFLVWAALDGGYRPTAWGPGALGLVGLLVVLLATAPQLLATLPRAGLAALALLGGFTLWTFLSLAWAGDEGEAWDAANRTLLYAAVYGVFLLWPWRARQAAVLLGAYALGVAGIAAATFVRAARADDPYAFFIGGRYVEPVGYVNADCALFLLAFWPAVFLASRRETPWWLRGLFLAAAGFLLQQAVLPQSRGSLFVFPVALALYLLVVPGRTRSLLALGPVLLATLLVRDPLLDVYSAARAETLPAALAALEEPLLGSAAALLALGTVYGLVDRFAPLPRDLARVGAWGLGLLTSVAALVAAVVLLAVHGNPVTRAQDAWDEFSAGQTFEESSSYFGANLGSNRYDFWRVALAEFRDSPVVGIGAGNFAAPYLRERESPEEPLYPHSLPVMVLSQTGAVGALLFAGFLVTALACAWVGRRRRSTFGNALAGAAVATFAYFALHGSIDWFWEFPGLAAPAFACLGLAGGLERPAAPRRERPRGWTPRRATAAALATLAVVAALASLALPWLAAREIERVAESWRSDPEEAYARLDRARTLNPLSARADLVEGAIALRRDEYDRAEDAFRRALARDGQNWYAELELGVLAALDGRREDSLEHLDRAEELNPLEEAVGIVRSGVRSGDPVDPAVVDRIFLQRVEERTS